MSRDDILNSLTIAGLHAGTLVCKLALAIFISRYLDLQSLGLYGLALGAVVVGPAIIGLGMVNVIMRDAVTLSLDKVTDQLRHYWVCAAAAYALIVVTALIAVFLFHAPWLVILIIFIGLFDHIGIDIYKLFLSRERPLLANVSAFVRGGGWIVVYVALALWSEHFRNLTTIFCFWIAGGVLAFLQFVWVTRKWPWREAFAQPLRISWIAQTIRSSFTIYLSDLFFVASQHLDRYVVTAFLGLKAAGVYFLYWSAANAVSMFVSVALLQVQRARLIKAYRQSGAQTHLELTSAVTKMTVLLSLGLSVLVAIAFYALLPLFGQPAVRDYFGALALIMAGMGVRNVADVGAMALFTAHRDRMMTVTNGVAVVALVACQLVLVPWGGLYGAGAAILIAFGAIALWRHALLFGNGQRQDELGGRDAAGAAKSKI